ncbi:MAG TPA: hypothetical protein EYG80_05790 [Flavobacteriaceae bacterium]|nr:hypothetical protein [Flavobacteriaceae bacterium]
MTSSTNAIFVNENENIFEACANHELMVNAEIRKHLKFISHKANNNYIGYYQFLGEDDVYYKIYILPKTTPRVENNEELNKKNFIGLLSKYYELKQRYGSVKSKIVNKNIIDFSFENDKKENKSDELDDFIAYKYNDALQTIESFFKRHKNALSQELKFHSQSIRHRLDLKQNIIELDKSKIHQRKKEPYLYSKLAEISIEVLQYFIKHKEKNKVAKKLKNKIKSKYSIDKNFSFKTKEIVSKKVLKLFKKSDEKELYLAFLTLLGIESYFEDNTYKEMIKLHNQHAHFFRPEKLFEWVVYDDLINKYGKDAVSKEHKQSYKLAGEDRESKPDFVIQYENVTMVIDAKWKILKTKKDITFEDVAKLRRDGIILDNISKSLLIYPQIEFDTRDITMNIDDFRFTIEERKI